MTATLTPVDEPTGARVEIPSEFVKICHYGTGKFADSPVTLVVPQRLSERGVTLVVTLEFALAFREAYELSTAASEVRKLAGEMGDLTRRWRAGDYDWCKRFQRDLVRFWQRNDRASILSFPRRKSAEEELEDSLGLLAAFGELSHPARPTGGMDGTWMEATRFFNLKRAFIDGAISVAALSGAGATVALAEDPRNALWFAFTAFILRFSRPLSKTAPDLGPLEHEAYYQYPGNHKARRPLAKAMLKGARGEEVLQLVAQAKREYLVAEESQALAERITEELSPLAPEPTTRSLFTAAQEAASPEAAPSWDLLQAQRALLAEVRETRAIHG